MANIKCPNCGATGKHVRITSRKTEPGMETHSIADIKPITVAIRRKCSKCENKWTTNPHKNWRWIYGTRIERWILVPPSDFDWEMYGITQTDMKVIGKKRALECQGGAHFIR